MGAESHKRLHIHPGLEVDIVLKKDQRSGELTHGIVKDILTSKAIHPRGIKVRLESGQVGRVQHIEGYAQEEEKDDDDFDNFI